MKCDQCNAAMINGVFCHEHGCPNTQKKFVEGDWLSFYTCHECGDSIRKGEYCDCSIENVDAFYTDSEDN